MLKGKKSSSRAAFHAALHAKAPHLFFFTLFSAIVSTWQISKEALPSANHPVILYSSQDRSDLKRLYLQALCKAKRDIFLMIYGLADEDIITALRDKIDRNVSVGIFFDPSGSKNLSKFLPKRSIQAQPSKGLMHKKVLCIDEELTLLGSANLTETSLRLHDNLVIGFYDPSLVRYLKNPIKPFHTLQTQEQTATIWSLPQKESTPINTIIEAINKAKTSIQICMFTFTHKQICQALHEAARRGVKVEVALDGYTATGASKQIASSLRCGGIFLHTSKKGKLLHHKWCLIDEKLLIMGSTNWTQAAFKKNDDIIITLEPLTPKQLQRIKNTWNKTVKGI